MNIRILVILFLFASITSFAQKDTTLNTDKEFEIIENMKEPQELEKEEPIYIHVNQMPKFPGGLTALRSFIANNVIYPLNAKERGIQGTVFLRFEIKKDGDIGKIEIQKGVHVLLDVEAKKVIRKLPKFSSGEQNRKKVNVWYSLPITFRLN